MAYQLDDVQDIDIDEGRFKYILIKVHHSREGEEISKYIVRGYNHCEYHADIYDEIAPSIEKNGLDCECVGGGRILHNPQEKKIEVYGYSQGNGRAEHTISVSILKRKYTDYEIPSSNEGY